MMDLIEKNLMNSTILIPSSFASMITQEQQYISTTCRSAIDVVMSETTLEN